MTAQAPGLSTPTSQILLVKQCKESTTTDLPPPPGRLIHVESEPNDWIITVPLEYDDGVHWTEMQADLGADACGINAQWAIDTFGSTIQQTTHALDIDTPGGIVKSNVFVNLFFKRYDDVTWTTRFYLLPKLPVKLLAGKNLLESFGYCWDIGSS